MTADWELSGLHLDRPLETGMVWAPGVDRIENGTIYYRAGRKVKNRAGSGLLQTFVNLRDEVAVSKFARQWGVLSLCEHGMPQWHRQSAPCGIHYSEKPYAVESVGDWILAAEAFSSMVNYAARLNLNQPPLEADVRVFGCWMGRPGESAIEEWEIALCVEHPEIARTRMGLLVDTLVRMASVAPRLAWNKKRRLWQMELDSQSGGSNLLAILTIQLMLVIADTDGFAVCSSCGRAYVPKRRPNPNRRNYCHRCGPAVAQRDASRAYRRRKTE